MEDPRIPIWTPIVALLKSRAFIALIVGALIDVIILLVPALLPVREELLNYVTLGILAIVGKMGLEDAAQKLGRDAADTEASGQTTALRAQVAVQAAKAAKVKKPV